jgi:hypothetical protein
MIDDDDGSDPIEETEYAKKGYGLPRWFATRGPEPGWLAGHWVLTLTVLGAVLVLVNMVTQQRFLTVEQGEWLNAIVAWGSALLVYLQGRVGKVRAVAEWRKQVRDEEAAQEGREKLLGEAPE